MSNHLAAVLSRGIERLAQGQTIEQYMGHVDARTLSPPQQQELRELLELSARLLPLRDAAIPAATARAANRARFLSQAIQLKEGPARQAVRPGWRIPTQLRRGLVSVLVSLALLLIIGSGAVSTAADSLPGSPLYVLKLTVEDARLTLTSSQPARASLYLRYANERTNEMLRLTAAGHAPSPAVVTRLEQQLNGALKAAEATESEQQRQLLAQVIETTTTQQETLRRALEGAPVEAQAVLEAGVATAAQTGQQAFDALEKLSPPTATPTTEPSDTPRPSDTPSKPAVVPVDSPTPQPSVTLPAVATTTHTAPPAVGQPTTVTPSLTASVTPSRPVTPGEKPSATLSPEPTRTASLTASPVSPTATATLPPPTPTDTPQPTDTPAPVFRLTNDDNPDPVPASYRIHYVVCVVNEGPVALTNVTITDKWSPRECLYYLPGNPTELRWDIGTVEPGGRECVLFSLNTYSICGGRTAVNEASMSCDQGSASAVQYTRIAGTPTPTFTPTITTTVTPALTLTPTYTLTPTATLTDTPTLTPTWTPSATWTPDATMTATSTLTPTANGAPTASSPAR
jgi:hypothetical protein